MSTACPARGLRITQVRRISSLRWRTREEEAGGKPEEIQGQSQHRHREAPAPSSSATTVVAAILSGTTPESSEARMVPSYHRRWDGHRKKRLLCLAPAKIAMDKTQARRRHLGPTAPGKLIMTRARSTDRLRHGGRSETHTNRKKTKNHTQTHLQR